MCCRAYLVGHVLQVDSRTGQLQNHFALHKATLTCPEGKFSVPVFVLVSREGQFIRSWPDWEVSSVTSATWIDAHQVAVLGADDRVYLLPAQSTCVFRRLPMDLKVLHHSLQGFD